jgi:hypothetical protein
MKRFKILLLAISFLLFAIFAQELIFGSYGEFGDGTGSKDSVWMNVSTFDTLGYVADADSVLFIRFYRTTKIDSTFLTGAGTRTGYYLTGKRAFDGTNYGEYTVDIRWKVQGKNFKKAESYTVVDYYDTTEIYDGMVGRGFAQTGTDKTWRLRGLAIRGTSGSDTAFIAKGYGYGMGLFINGGSTGADAIYALGGGTGAGLHAKGGSGDGAEGIFAEGTGSGPGTYYLGGSSAPGLQVIGQGAGAGIRADGGSSGNGITATGFATGSGMKAIKGASGYDIYGNVHGYLDSLLYRTNYVLTSAYFTKADSGSTGASYLRVKYVEDKTGYAISSAGLSAMAMVLGDSLEARYTLSGIMSIAYAIPGVSGCKQTFYRPTATSAPDSVRVVCGATLRGRAIYTYNGSGKLNDADIYIYK